MAKWENDNGTPDIENFGKDTEFHEAEVLAFSEDKLVLQVGNQIAEIVVALAEVTRIEITME